MPHLFFESPERGERHARNRKVSKKSLQVNNNAISRESIKNGKNEKLKRESLKLKSDTMHEICRIKTEMDKLKKKHKSYVDKVLNISTNAACTPADGILPKTGSSIDYSYTGKSSGSSVYYNDTASIQEMSRIKAEMSRLKKTHNSYVDKLVNVSTNARRSGGLPSSERISQLSETTYSDEYSAADNSSNSNGEDVFWPDTLETEDSDDYTDSRADRLYSSDDTLHSTNSPSTSDHIVENWFGVSDDSGYGSGELTSGSNQEEQKQF